MTDIETAQLIESLPARYHSQSTRVWLLEQIEAKHNGFIQFDRQGHITAVTASQTARNWADDVLHKRYVNE